MAVYIMYPVHELNHFLLSISLSNMFPWLPLHSQALVWVLGYWQCLGQVGRLPCRPGLPGKHAPEANLCYRKKVARGWVLLGRLWRGRGETEVQQIK